MLTKKAIERIAALTKTKVTDIEAAIKDPAEVELTIDEKLSVFSEDEVTTLKGNSYKDGKKAGVEMEVDDVKKESGLEFQGKTVKGLIEAVKIKTLADAKIEPDKKVTELEGKLKTVQQTATELQTKLAEKETEVSGIKTQTLIAKDIPAATLPADKVLLLMKADGYDYKMEDNKIIWHKDGKAVTDKLGNNVDTKTVTTDYITTNKLSALADDGKGGRGGGDNKPPVNVFTKMSDIKAKYTAEGKNMLGEDFARDVAAAKTADANFDMNS